MTEQDEFNDLPSLVLHEGFILDHNGNMVVTVHVDFRMPDERSPIGVLIKYGQTKHAVEEGGTIQLTRPPYFRKKGETLIYDEGEGKTDTDKYTIEWGNRDFWLYCTAMEPTSDAQRTALVASLDQDYDHESCIPSARTFAQMLGRAYVEQCGAPYDAEDPMEHKFGGVFVGNTYHCKIGVFHGPVVYVDDPYAVYTSALANQNSMVRAMMPIFVKHTDYNHQREYRFVILDKAEHEAESKIIPAPPLLLAAVGSPGDSKGPMVIPDFHIPE